jgi:hypothetical protein
MADVTFRIDLSGLDNGDECLDDFLRILRDDYQDNPRTTEEIMRWLLVNPDPDGDLNRSRHLTYLALICATAMQRLVP